MPLQEWAETYRILPKVGSPEPGRWSNSRTPYLIEIMDCLSPYNGIERIVLMKGVQIGGSEVIVNWIGQTIHQDPGAMLCMMPTIDIAKKWSKQRVQPMINETPVLRGKLKDPRDRDSGNTILTKEFPGGMLMAIGSNSASGMRAIPAGRVAFDEVDAYPVDVEGEGDAIELTRKRSSNFRNKKEIQVSTPTDKETSRIEREFQKTDQRYYHVPCPFCQHKQIIRWASIVWEDNNPLTAKMKCDSCEKLIDESYKTEMLAGGEWIPERPELSHKFRGYHISTLYSPIGWRSWAQCVEEFLESKNDVSKLKTFVNTVLGETWEEEGQLLEWEPLFNRREVYKARVPRGALVLTGGVDVHPDRLEVEIIGWGVGEESWSIDYEVIWGSPADSSTWDALDEFCSQPFATELGDSMRAVAVGIDTQGGFNKQAYKFCQQHPHRYYAFQGANAIGKALVSKPSVRSKVKVKLYNIGTDTAKTTIYSYLRKKEPGPGFCHFPMKYDEEYFRMLTAEKAVTKYRNGFPYRAWVPRRKRNETLDLRVYALAALNLINPNWVILVKKHLDAVKAIEEEKEEGQPIEVKSEAESIQIDSKEVEEDERPVPQRQRRKFNKRRRGGFATNY